MPSCTKSPFLQWLMVCTVDDTPVWTCLSWKKEPPPPKSQSLHNAISRYLVHMGGNHGVPLLPNMSIVSRGLCLKYFPGLYSYITQTPSLFRHSEKKPFLCLFQLSEVIFIHWFYLLKQQQWPKCSSRMVSGSSASILHI